MLTGPVDPLESLIARLEEVVVDIDDIMFDVLREASAAGDDQRPQSDKKLAQARRSVEKSVYLLRQVDLPG